MENFARKHTQLRTLWDACPEASLENSFQRMDFDERFDQTMAKKGLVKNFYKISQNIVGKIVACSRKKVTKIKLFIK